MLRASLLLLVLPVSVASSAQAQVTVASTFTDGAPALASEVNANFEALAAAVNVASCATEADVVCDPALSRSGCSSCPSSDTPGSYNQGFTELPAPRFEHQGTPPEKSTS